METILVCGPPGAGKTSWVEAHRKPGELVWDSDEIASLLCGTDAHSRPDGLLALLLDWRTLLFRELRQPTCPFPRAWIIASLPRREDRRRIRDHLGARVVVLATPQPVCLERVYSRPGEQDAAADGVRSWWRQYEPDPDDEVVSGE